MNTYWGYISEPKSPPLSYIQLFAYFMMRRHLIDIKCTPIDANDLRGLPNGKVYLPPGSI